MDRVSATCCFGRTAPAARSLQFSQSQSYGFASGITFDRNIPHHHVTIVLVAYSPQTIETQVENLLEWVHLAKLFRRITGQTSSAKLTRVAKDIITSMVTPLTPQVAPCPKCGKAIDPSDTYCRYCGFALLPQAQAALVDTYITTKIDQTLAVRLASEESLVRGIGDKVEDVVMRRLKYYLILISLGGAFVGWLGWHSFSDITDSAKRRLDPIVTDAVNKAQKVKEDIQATSQTVEQTKTEADGTKKKIDDLSTEVDKQRSRVDSESGEAGRKLAGLQQTVNKANEVADDLAKLDGQARNLETRYTALSQRVNSQAVAQAYPNIDVEPYVMLGGRTISKKDKKSGEIWVQVEVSYEAQAKNIISGHKLEQLVVDLQAAGITPQLGNPHLAGRVNWGSERMTTGDIYASSVIYTDPSKKAIADKLVPIVSRYVTLHQPQPEFVPLPTSSPMRPGSWALYWELGGFDAQVFISAAVD